MVRTLDYALTNALNSTTRRPALSLTIEDHVIHYASYQTPASADAWNDVCIAADRSIIRVQVTRGGTGFSSNFLVQRITDPAQASQWSSWSTLPASTGVIYQDGGCAVSNSGGVLHAFAQQGTGGSALWNWTSLDNGVTWSGPGVVLTPPSSALLKGIASSGNNDVFFLYDVVGGEAIGYSFYTSSWSALIRSCGGEDGFELYTGVFRYRYACLVYLQSQRQCVERWRGGGPGLYLRAWAGRAAPLVRRWSLYFDLHRTG
jgi:hypothetical protein